MELEVARQCWETSIPGSHVDGFIQQLWLYPFHVVFFTEQQILAYVRQCKSQSGAVVTWMWHCQPCSWQEHSVLLLSPVGWLKSSGDTIYHLLPWSCLAVESAADFQRRCTSRQQRTTGDSTVHHHGLLVHTPSRMCAGDEWWQPD